MLRGNRNGLIVDIKSWVDAIVLSSLPLLENIQKDRNGLIAYSMVPYVYFLGSGRIISPPLFVFRCYQHANILHSESSSLQRRENTPLLWKREQQLLVMQP